METSVSLEVVLSEEGQLRVISDWEDEPGQRTEKSEDVPGGRGEGGRGGNM